MKRILLSSSLLFLFSVFLSFPSQAQITPDPVDLTISLDNNPARRGENLRISLDFKIQEGWSINGLKPTTDGLLPVKIDLLNPGFSSKYSWVESATVIKKIDSIGLKLPVHNNQAQFVRNFDIPTTAPDGSNILRLNVEYQACNDRICLLPSAKIYNAELQIEAGEPRPNFLLANNNIDDIWSGADLSLGALFSLLAIAVSAGLLSILSPCVLPMLPLTIGYFSVRDGAASSSKYTKIFFFIISIVGIYSLVGYFLTKILGPGGVLKFSAAPATLGLSALIFFLLGLSLVFRAKIPVPSRILTFLDRASNKYSDVPSAIFVGISFTICSFLCNIQIIGALLVLLVTSGSSLIVLGLFVFALTQAIVLCFIGLIPRIKILKGGHWQDNLRSLVGYFLVLFGIKFLIDFDAVSGLQFISRSSALVLILVVTAAFIAQSFYQLKPKEHKTAQPAFLKPQYIIIFYLAAAVFFGYGLANYSLGSYVESYLPKPEKKLIRHGYITEQDKPLLWADKLNLAALTGEPSSDSASLKMTLVYFTGRSCINCRWFENAILEQSKVHQLLQNEFKLVKLYTDSGVDKEVNLNTQIELFNSVALPYFALISETQEIVARQAGVFKNSDEFIEFLSNKKID